MRGAPTRRCLSASARRRNAAEGLTPPQPEGRVGVAAAVRDGPHLPRASAFDRKAAFEVFINRGTRLATLGYLWAPP